MTISEDDAPSSVPDSCDIVRLALRLPDSGCGSIGGKGGRCFREPAWKKSDQEAGRLCVGAAARELWEGQKPHHTARGLAAVCCPPVAVAAHAFGDLSRRLTRDSSGVVPSKEINMKFSFATVDFSAVLDLSSPAATAAAGAGVLVLALVATDLAGALYRFVERTLVRLAVLRMQHLMVTQFNVDPLAEDAGPSLSDPELLMFVMEERQKIEDLNGAEEEDGADALMAHYQELFHNVIEGLDESLDAAAATRDDNTQLEVELRTLTSKVVRMQYLSKLKDECRALIEV